MKKKIVVVSGFFNPLHGGHLSHMKEAKKYGNELWVIVDNDQQQIIKKGKIILDEKERINIISELKCVDRVVLAVDRDISVAESIKKIAEENQNCTIILAKGGDRNFDNLPRAEQEVVKKYNIKVVSSVGAEKVNSSSRINELLNDNVKQE
ncbi:MAG: adenylyltransferase/cytidyltransferase family protein [Candidatus Latescibacteria bacterium]|nr:adenylyltransferase/cytidyltransferase family protein [Candidatus Latescibacterota bacterium]